MSRTGTSRRYGKPTKRSKAERLFAELPQTPIRAPAAAVVDDDVKSITRDLSEIQLDENDHESPARNTRQAKLRKSIAPPRIPSPHTADPQKPGETPGAAGPREVGYEQNKSTSDQPHISKATVPDAAISSHEIYLPIHEDDPKATTKLPPDHVDPEPELDPNIDPNLDPNATLLTEDGLRILGWDEVCPPEDGIEKIAEASFAEVYRVANERGTSIIKVIRLDSPIKAQTKSQVRAGLVDEEPHSEADIQGELQISEWLADIPGFVVYKERYVVQGKATRELLDTHQRFQRRMKRKDPGRAQFYPSPSRYLDETRFLVVELGDAGVALEDWKLDSKDQMWDAFFLVAIALARAEDTAMFEHRDLHEGNVCIRQTRSPRQREEGEGPESRFGISGIDITILDYGLSRAEDLSIDFAKPIAYDLDKDLSLFTSTHAPQCKVYRQMRSFLLRSDRQCLPPESHTTLHEAGVHGPLSWDAYAPYSNVLWLAYLYEFMVGQFAGDKKDLQRFKKETQELWKHLDPDADDSVPCFGSAADVVQFGVEAGWLQEEQLMGCGNSTIIDREDSIIVSRDDSGSGGEGPRRRSSRRH